jgi:2,2-dialkylglycine decarboxylase (pyruvate)
VAQLNRNSQSIALWEKYGNYLLMAMPYADGLITDAQGCTLKDIDGNELLDLAAGQFCSIVGHNHPKLIEKITEQLKRVMHVGTQFLSPIVLEAAEKFAQVAPGKLKKSLFLSTGTEANECAINIAKMYTGKTGMVGFSRGYYGLSLATKSLTNIFAGPGRSGDLPRVPETDRLLTPYCFRCPVHNHYPECNLSCLEAGIEAGVAAPENLAAVIVEPIVSAGGMIIPPPGYLKALKAFAQQHGALLIVDEAQTGFGRTGKWFAIEHHEVEPDILVVSKSAGGGYPVSGLITRDDIADAIVSKGFGHLASHQSDPPAAAAVAAIIDIVREEGLLSAAAENGQYFLDRLRELQSRHSIVADVRGQGLMLGIELSNPDDKGQTRDLAFPVTILCRAKGVHLTYTYFEPVLRIIPPLTLQRSQIDIAISALDEAFREVSSRNFRLEALLPNNPYSRPYIDKMRGKASLKKILSRLYATAPEYWIKKLSEAAGK